MESFHRRLFPSSVEETPTPLSPRCLQCKSLQLSMYGPLERPIRCRAPSVHVLNFDEKTLQPQLLNKP